MHSRIFQAWAVCFGRMLKCGPQRPALWAALSIFLPMLAAGCGGNTSVDSAQVSGKVLFKGKPLQGGRLTFLTVKGGFAHVGDIDENGNYTIEAPVGDVKIAVDNRILKTAAAATKHPILKRPDSEAPAPVKGKYVEIPSKYYTADTSGLTYTVGSGTQTHDITLD